MALETAQEALLSLLKSGNVSCVVYIDDVFAFQGDVDVERVLGWYSQTLRTAQEAALALVAVNYPVPDDDIWRIEFREKWDLLSANEKARIVSELSVLLNEQLRTDDQVASQLRQIFPPEFEYRAIAPSEWVDQRDQILAGIDGSSRIVCLFDQDLSADSGFASTGTLSGGGLLKELIDSFDESVLLCGILSHTISSTENESQYHATFAVQHQIDGLETNRFLPLSKSRLNEPIKFVDGFKKLLLHRLCESIKHSAIGILQEAHQAAVNKISTLDVYSFDRMILKAAHRANDWEIETVFRLFQIYQRNELRLRLADLDMANSLSELIVKARPTSQIRTVEEEYVYPRVREIRRNELYESAELICYRPLETGDIFVSNENSDKQKYYILLAQPCDLAVRLNGTRTQSYVSLVPIVEGNDRYSSRKTRSKWQDFWSTRAIIESFAKDENILAFLEFKEAVAVKTAVLDLAVMHSDGQCSIDVGLVEIPNHLTEGWKTLLENRIAFYTGIKNKLQDLDPDGEQLEFCLPEFSFPPIVTTAPPNGGVFDFGLKRVERYRHPGASELLKQYSHFLSREAKDFDFAA